MKIAQHRLFYGGAAKSVYTPIKFWNFMTGLSGRLIARCSVARRLYRRAAAAAIMPPHFSDTLCRSLRSTSAP